MRFFLDNCMSPYHAKGLMGFAEAQRVEIVHLRDRFDEDTPDAVWLGELARDGNWVFISGDTRITRSPVEKAAWEQSGLTGFFFAPPFQSAGHWKQAVAVVSWWPDIFRQTRESPAGHGFLLPYNGRQMRLIYPTGQR